MRLQHVLPTAGILTLLFSTHAFAGPIVVACGPGQHTIVRDAFVRGERVTRVECSSRGAYRPIAYRTEYRPRHRAEYLTRHRVTHRSWGKTALIIGGGAGTGAGIGGIIHGKKGALIGAAVGGGVASLYEGAHRR